MRSVIAMDIERIADSCGFGVPKFEISVNCRVHCSGKPWSGKGEEGLARLSAREQLSAHRRATWLAADIVNTLARVWPGPEWYAALSS